MLGNWQKTIRDQEQDTDHITPLFFCFFSHTDSRCSSGSAQSEEQSWDLNFIELDTCCNFPLSQLPDAAHSSLEKQCICPQRGKNAFFQVDRRLALPCPLALTGAGGGHLRKEYNSRTGFQWCFSEQSLTDFGRKQLGFMSQRLPLHLCVWQPSVDFSFRDVFNPFFILASTTSHGSKF